MPDGYKKILLPLIDIIRADIVSKSIKIMESMDHVFYVNGSLGALDILKKYIADGIKGMQDEQVSSLTRKVLAPKTKPGQGKGKKIRR